MATETETDQEEYDRKQAELAADREEHNRRTGGGDYPKKHEVEVDHYRNPVD